jgi:hypothetical protein
MSVELSESLKCGCNSQVFFKIVELVWKNDAGVVERPMGYECKKCHTLANMAVLQTRAKQRHLEAQMDELREMEKQNQATLAHAEKKSDATRKLPNEIA